MADKRPLCKLCGERHWLREPHVYHLRVLALDIPGETTGTVVTIGEIIQAQTPAVGNHTVTNKRRALKAELREKYGEFDIDRDLEAQREQRLAVLDVSVAENHTGTKYRKHLGRGGVRSGAGRPRHASPR